MTAIIKGTTVQGTPEEIKQLIDVFGENSPKTSDDPNNLPDWSTPYTRRMKQPWEYPFPTRYYDPWYYYDNWWGIYPPNYGSTGDGIEYLKYQPTCTSTTTWKLESKGESK